MKAAIVTGASSGIGQSAAIEIAKRGTGVEETARIPGVAAACETSPVSPAAVQGRRAASLPGLGSGSASYVGRPCSGRFCGEPAQDLGPEDPARKGAWT